MKWRTKKAGVQKRAEADMELIDGYFPRLGPCGICGDPDADQRHRVLDAIADRINAGEAVQAVAADYLVPAEVAAAVGRTWEVTEGDVPFT